MPMTMAVMTVKIAMTMKITLPVTVMTKTCLIVNDQ